MITYSKPSTLKSDEVENGMHYEICVIGEKRHQLQLFKETLLDYWTFSFEPEGLVIRRKKQVSNVSKINLKCFQNPIKHPSLTERFTKIVPGF